MEKKYPTRKINQLNIERKTVVWSGYIISSSMAESASVCVWSDSVVCVYGLVCMCVRYCMCVCSFMLKMLHMDSVAVAKEYVRTQLTGSQSVDVCVRANVSDFWLTYCPS